MNDKLQQIFRSVDERHTVAAYVQAARELRSHAKQLCPVRVSLLSTFTIDPLVPYLEVEAARQGFAADVYIGPFNTVKQELLNPESGCLCHQPSIVFVAQLLSDVCPPLAYDFLALNHVQIEQYIEEIIADIIATLKTFRRHSDAAVVIHNFEIPSNPLLGIHEVMAQVSQTETIRTLNTRLVSVVKPLAGVYVLDFERLSAEVGYKNWYDQKMWYLGRAPLSAQIHPVLAKCQATYLQAILGNPKKCLVLDLDNTLWGGIIGEDGVAGIKLGQTYPGNAFRHFQNVVLQFYRQGVILAINSKNNRADVEEVFQSHPDMLLKLEHFASTRINWSSKYENMMEIAEELNIGLDSLVFFDDNPSERALMRQMIPEILTLEVPDDPLKYSEVLLESRVFDKLSFNEEDRIRGKMYRGQVERKRLEIASNSLEDFYRNLRMTVSINRLDKFAFPRVSDLIQKTNQFNLTTRRYSISQLTEMMNSSNKCVFYLQVSDLYGDNGIVGVAILQANDENAFIDSFLLSCRVIGRTLETAFLAFLVDWTKRTWGVKMIEGEFIPTAKNTPASDFYSRHGFTHVVNEDVGSKWRLIIDDISFEWPGYIRLAEEVENRK